MVKEALTNVLKHSAASEVMIRAQVEGETLEIRVHDNGRGFTAESKRAQGQGHGNMHRRAEAAGSTLKNQGTTVVLRVNLSRLASGKK